LIAAPRHRALSIKRSPKEPDDLAEQIYEDFHKEHWTNYEFHLRGVETTIRSAIEQILKFLPPDLVRRGTLEQFQALTGILWREDHCLDVLGVAPLGWLQSTLLQRSAGDLIPPALHLLRGVPRR
jgi:hypothetical protein